MSKQRVGRAMAGLLAALFAGYATRAEAVSAAGGTVTQYVDAGGTNWVAHSFTDVGTTNLMVTDGGAIEVLVVGGGGGGGRGFGAGGGAGGYRQLTSNVVAGTYTVVVGDGGAGASNANTRGSSGAPSSFAGSQAAGGGGGGGGDSGTGQPDGAAGGSGGGGSHQGVGGAGNTPATSPSQGNSGANGGSGVYGGGGGGAGAAATDKNGGSGRYSAITGVSVERAGGGGGNSTTGRGVASGGGGGLVGGVLTSAAPNTGGGGYGDGNGTNNRGGSGIVVVRYAVSYPLVQNRPVSDVTTSSATLNGTLASTGAPPAEAVSVLWGPDPDAWASTNAWTGGGWTNGTPFSTNIASGIGANTTYYYTFRAATAATNVTASPPVSFITGVVTVEATAPTAQYPGSSGEFTIRRPATCTNAALTVPYTLGGSAVSNVDYTLSSWSSVTLEAGQANRVVTVSPLPDFDSANENVVLTLGAGAYPTGAMVTATVTILPAEVGVKAMGGTVTTYREGGANWTAHSFTDVGTTSLTVTADGVIEVLVVGGGGGGGQGFGAGGGAGGYREFVSGIVAGTHMVLVGDGGAGAATSNTRGSSGSPSSFAGIQAAGGGGGGGGDSAGDLNGAAGGSGGGGSHSGAGGAGNTPATSPSQGNSGANGSFGVYGGGGGGAGAAATDKNGGSSRYSAITGVSVERAGGGGGNSTTGRGAASGGGGGLVGGVLTSAAPNTGGGGYGDGNGTNNKGGSGIVVVRYQSLSKGTVVIIR